MKKMKSYLLEVIRVNSRYPFDYAQGGRRLLHPQGGFAKTEK